MAVRHSAPPAAGTAEALPPEGGGAEPWEALLAWVREVAPELEPGEPSAEPA